MAALITERMKLLRLRARSSLGHLRRNESKFVTGYLRGLEGIEIGASAHNSYHLKAINIDRFGSMKTPYKEEERRLAGRKAKVDVIAPGDELPFADASYDFVFSSHVIEHFPDPIKALEEWMRVARRYVVVVAPHRDRTTDSERDLTSTEELLQRHAEGFSSDIEEPTHWSVWTCETFIELCERIGLRVVDSLDPDDKVGNGFAVVIDASARSGDQSALA